MTRLLPFPLISLCLLAMWLGLNQTVSLGQALLGGAFAILGGWLMKALQPTPTKIRNPRAALRLAALVMADVIRSNFAVARIILSPGRRRIVSGFVRIPLTLSNRQGLAVLACIITSTPGTLWVSFNPASGMLRIHVLDLVEEDDWIAHIKGRYERPLLEIFH